MDTSSEYTFPIFISSTDYNLKDLRAELARFLTELGYKPILSSAEGFPDSSPILEPWESCIPVLEKSFVMILIVDGRYGSGLKWPNYETYFSDKRISPTHGEYIFAHKNRKRMLVFIRKTLMPHYQSYRLVMERCKNNKEEAEKILTPTLPEYVSFQTLDFINEVKTTKPIPWINEFEDITTIKREVQKKMLNELAELFLIKNKHFETVIESFNKVMDSLTIDKQKEVLRNINAAKGIISTADKIEGLQKEIEEKTKLLEEAKINKTEDEQKYTDKIGELKEKINFLEKETLKLDDSQFFIKDGNIQIGDPSFSSNAIFSSGSFLNSKVEFNINGTNHDEIKCENCGKIDFGSLKTISGTYISSGVNTLSKCPSCKKYYCNTCWPNSDLFGYANFSLSVINKCPKCESRNPFIVN